MWKQAALHRRKRYMPRQPSSRRERIYAAILDYAAEHGGNTPTIRELQALAGISSSSVVSYHLYGLACQGRLERRDNKWIVVGSIWIPPREGAEHDGE